MKILVNYGPLIGVMATVIYCICVQIFLIAKKKKSASKNQKKGFYCLIAMEAALILVSIAVPKVTDKSYLIDGTNTTIGGNCVITPAKFKVSYIESNRNYSDRISLNEEELANIRAVCSSNKGTVFLRITQNDTQVTSDISNTDVLLDMSEFEPGDIRFTLVSADARNVKFELIW